MKRKLCKKLFWKQKKIRSKSVYYLVVANFFSFFLCGLAQSADKNEVCSTSGPRLVAEHKTQREKISEREFEDSEKWKRWARLQLETLQEFLPLSPHHRNLELAADEWMIFYGYAAQSNKPKILESLDRILTLEEQGLKRLCEKGSRRR